MGDRRNAAWLVLGLSLVTGLAYLGARYWQSGSVAYQRVAGPDACELRAGECRQAVGDGVVTLSISPPAIPLMQTLVLRVGVEGAAASAVEVDIRGLNMDMGLNRSVLRQVGGGRWEAETILPICSQRRMEWEAAVRVHMGGRYEIPFPFHTQRP